MSTRRWHYMTAAALAGAMALTGAGCGDARPKDSQEVESSAAEVTTDSLTVVSDSSEGAPGLGVRLGPRMSSPSLAGPQKSNSARLKMPSKYATPEE